MGNRVCTCSLVVLRHRHTYLSAKGDTLTALLISGSYMIQYGHRQLFPRQIATRLEQGVVLYIPHHRSCGD